MLTRPVNVQKPYQFGKIKVTTASQESKIPAPLAGKGENVNAPELPANLGSTLEGRYYLALLENGWKPEQIEIQTPVLGGRSWPGGQVLDFILRTPYPQPIKVNGEHFHDNDEVEMEKDWKIRERFNIPVVILWGEEGETVEEATATVARKIGRAG